MGKESTFNAGDAGSIPGARRSPGGVNGNPFQYSCLGNSIDRRAWQATIQGVARVRQDIATKITIAMSPSGIWKLSYHT